jgi:flagellar biosynthetic protein FliR
VNVVYDQLVKELVWYLLPIFRVAAFVTAAPIFSTGMIPVRIRLIIAVTISIAIFPGLTPSTNIDPVSLSMVLMILQQVLIGLSLGFVMQFIFAAVVNGGQLIGMQMGLGFAQMMDPQTGVNVPVVSQFYNIIAVLLFLSINGHLVLVQILGESFNLIPVTGEGMSMSAIESLVFFSTWMFSGALIMVLPAVVALLMINMVMGVITRATPQMNIFSVGFSITITAGFIVIMVTLSTALPQLVLLFNEGFMFMREMLNS